MEVESLPSEAGQIRGIEVEDQVPVCAFSEAVSPLVCDAKLEPATRPGGERHRDLVTDSNAARSVTDAAGITLSTAAGTRHGPQGGDAQLGTVEKLINAYGQAKDDVLAVLIRTNRTDATKSAANPVHQPLTGPLSIQCLPLGFEDRLALIVCVLLAVFGVIAFRALAPGAPSCVEIFGLGGLFALLRPRSEMLLAPEIRLFGVTPAGRSSLGDLARALSPIGAGSGGLRRRLLGPPVGGRAG